MSRSGPAWRDPLATAGLVLLGLTLYGRGLALGYVGDDFALLDAARRFPLGELLSGRHGVAGFYRPISRELYFWWWGRVLGLGPGGFHLVNALTFAAVVGMIERLGREWVGPRAGRLAAAAFVVFPPGSALLSWVSCAQDLIALFWAMAALLLYWRGRHGLAAIAVALATLSKETVVALPVALAALERRLHPGETARRALARVGPSLIGLAAALGLAVGVRSTWPAGTAIAVWSPGQIVGAWRLPLDFAGAYFPPDTLSGVAEAFGTQPVMITIAAICAALAVLRPRGLPGASQPAGRHAPQSSARSRGAGPSAGVAYAQPGPERDLLGFGVVLAVVALLPVAFVVERWRAYYFSLAGVGASLALGVLMNPLAPRLAAGLFALAAVVNAGAGGIYRPVESAAGPARHPYVNYAFFRDTGALSARLLAALRPWCSSLQAAPRTFAAGIPPDPVFTSVLGPGLRVACSDTAVRVRFLSEFTAADASADFGVLRFDPRAGRFVHERADPRVRALIGEGFLIHAHYPIAVACFEAATGGRPADRELSYPLVAALAAAGRPSDAEREWRAASARGAVLDGATLAERLLGRVGPAPEATRDARPAGGASAGSGTRPAAADSTRAALAPLTAAVLREPWQAAPHRALGRELLARGRAREAAFELAIVGGITHQASDLVGLARAYEAIGALDEALAAYRTALSAGLPKDLYQPTRDRLLALARRTGAALDRSGSGP